MWSRCGPVRKVPERTTLRKCRSLATSHCTVTGAPLPEPGVAFAVGVTLVQISTEVGNGSPEATPCRNFGERRRSASAARAVTGPAPSTPVASAPVARTVRRFSAVTSTPTTEAESCDARVHQITHCSPAGHDG